LNIAESYFVGTVTRPLNDAINQRHLS